LNMQKVTEEQLEKYETIKSATNAEEQMSRLLILSLKKMN